MDKPIGMHRIDSNEFQCHTIECGFCGSKAGEKCTFNSGLTAVWAYYPHATRVNDYMIAQESANAH